MIDYRLIDFFHASSPLLASTALLAGCHNCGETQICAKMKVLFKLSCELMFSVV